jgi:hypothetical protein
MSMLKAAAWTASMVATPGTGPLAREKQAVKLLSFMGEREIRK